MGKLFLSGLSGVVMNRFGALVNKDLMFRFLFIAVATANANMLADEDESVEQMMTDLAWEILPADVTKELHLQQAQGIDHMRNESTPGLMMIRLLGMIAQDAPAQGRRLLHTREGE